MYSLSVKTRGKKNLQQCRQIDTQDAAERPAGQLVELERERERERMRE